MSLEDLYEWGEEIKNISDNTERGIAIEAWFESSFVIETDDCIIWPFAKDKAGYGMIKRHDYVHIIVCQRVHGVSNLYSCHGPCNNKSCINKNHLSPKTQAENMKDKLRDGTHDKGTNNSRAKFSELEVKEILRLYHEDRLPNGKFKWTQTQIAKMFHCTKQTIGNVIHGNHYKR